MSSSLNGNALVQRRLEDLRSEIDRLVITKSSAIAIPVGDDPISREAVGLFIEDYLEAFMIERLGVHPPADFTCAMMEYYREAMQRRKGTFYLTLPSQKR